MKESHLNSTFKIYKKSFFNIFPYVYWIFQNNFYGNILLRVFLVIQEISINIKISKKIKLEIYNTLKKEKLIFDEEKWMDFLNSIWDLRTMPAKKVVVRY